MNQPADAAAVTQMLIDLREGEGNRWEELLGAVYQELRSLAESRMRQERGDHTLSPTALVNEAYLRLVERRERVWENRRHFFGAASQVMRQVLVDHARRKNRQKRGGGAEREPLDGVLVDFEDRSCDLVALDTALEKLSEQSEEASRIVELRFFAGLTVPETAQVLGVSESTVERQWRLARAWLKNELDPDRCG
ncbi:MAG: sigma-70 family RNA polymerase sigma factor [Planctomycetota bacterium]